MKYIITLLIALLGCTSLSAQNIKVEKSQSAAEALLEIDQIKRAKTVMGYRVGIFFDNGQQARQKASEARKLFADNFPSQPVYMVYESPYYKVSAGNCLTEEEAIMLFERIRTVFPNAYVMRENMEISAFTDTTAEIAISTDSLSLQPAL